MAYQVGQLAVEGRQVGGPEPAAPETLKETADSLAFARFVADIQREISHRLEARGHRVDGLGLHAALDRLALGVFGSIAEGRHGGS